MKEELEEILNPLGWEVGSGPVSKAHLAYWSVYPDIFDNPPHPVDEVIKLLILAGYDARPLRVHLIAVWL